MGLMNAPTERSRTGAPPCFMIESSDRQQLSGLATEVLAIAIGLFLDSHPSLSIWSCPKLEVRMEMGEFFPFERLKGVPQTIGKP